MDNLIRLRDKATRLDMKTRFLFWAETAENLHKASNGAGPDWMYSGLRKGLSWFLRTFEATILVHDDDFQNSDGTEGGFSRANMNLLINGRKEARDTYSWYAYPLRLIAYGKIRLAYTSCKVGAWRAWQDGFEGKIHRMNDYKRGVIK